MDIDRYSTTIESLHETLSKEGADRAAILAVLTCLSAENKDHLAVDLQAVGHLYPALLCDKTKPLIALLLNIASLSLSFSEHQKKSVNRLINAIDIDDISAAWKISIWSTNRKSD